MQEIYLEKIEDSIKIKVENLDIVIYADKETIKYLIDILKIIDLDYLDSFLEFIIVCQEYIVPPKVFSDIYMAMKISKKEFRNYLKRLKVYISVMNFYDIEEVNWILNILENFKTARLLIDDLENYRILNKYTNYLNSKVKKNSK